MSIEELINEDDPSTVLPVKNNLSPTPTPTLDSSSHVDGENNHDGQSDSVNNPGTDNIAAAPEIPPTPEHDTKRQKKSGPLSGKKPSAEVLQRRKEGRIKAAATIAQNLKKTGIGRFEKENGFGLTSLRPMPLINQKNYFTDYLKKDEQVSFIRNWRAERAAASAQSKKRAAAKEGTTDGDDKNNWQDFNLNDIEMEMNKKKADEAAAAEEEEEEEDDENDVEETTDEKAKAGHDTVIIQPGSSYIRIGRATDTVPRVVPNVIAVKGRNACYSETPTPTRETDENGDIHFNEQFDEIKQTVTKDFKARMRFYKRRILPNSRESAANYNKKQEPEKIPDHNDPFKKEWVDLSSSESQAKNFYVGEDALKLPLGTDHAKNQNWILRYPMVNGNFNLNSVDYSSQQELLGDLANIIVETLNQMDIKNLPHLKAILVIPDLYDKTYVEVWVDLLFRLVGFGKVAIIQEAVAATFGAGATCACVIDVGAQTTSITCVDDGLVVNDSRVLLNYGGDQITETFIKLLLESAFPYKDINLSRRNDDWELAQSLKNDFVTFQDADIAVQLYNFYKRKPNETTEKYEFKVFDEVMLAPLGLFFPDLFQIGTSNTAIPSLASSTDANPTSSRFFLGSVDQYTGQPNNPQSRSQQDLAINLPYADQTEDQLLLRLLEPKNATKDNGSRTSESISHVPLEKAIIESISNAGLATDLSKIKKYYDNLLIVGGGLAKIPGFDLLLSDRINIWRPKILSSDSLEQVIAYVGKELKKSEDAKTKLINELKSKRMTEDQTLDDIELEESEIQEIEKQTEVNLDFDIIDSLCNQGTVFSINVLPPPREFDPAMLTWKGGSVYAKLKVVQEMWISSQDWNTLDSRSIYYKTMFNY